MFNGASRGIIARLPLGNKEPQIDSRRLLVAVFPSQLLRIMYTLKIVLNTSRKFAEIKIKGSSQNI